MRFKTQEKLLQFNISQDVASIAQIEARIHTLTTTMPSESRSNPPRQLRSTLLNIISVEFSGETQRTT